MGRTLVTGGPDMVGSRVLRLFLAAGRDVRQMLDTRDLRQGGRVSFIALDHDHDPLDAAAGCEYVDDQIRLQD
jgi:nucleoside-diphosphate-sugar epimerase